MDGDTRQVDVNFADAAKLGNELLVRLDRIRETDPIFWSDINKCWVVTGHREVVEGYRGDLPLSNVKLHHAFAAVPVEEQQKRIPYLMESMPQWLIDMDPPDQPRLRRLMMKAFSRPVIEGMRPVAKQIINETLDAIAGKDEIEFVSAVARQIPSRVILRLMGLSDELIGPMRRWADTINATFGGLDRSVALLERAEAVMHEMRGYFLPLIEERRRNPTDDFISALVTARDEGNKLSEEELLGICYLTLLAGNDSTGGTIILSTVALAQHPEVCDYIRAHPDPASMMNVVMELQRFVAMSMNQVRIVAQDFEWHGHPLKAGQFVFLFIAGANRDPKVFAEPLKLDPTRPQDANMTFAPGLHFCIGHLLAKMQLVEFFPELLRRYDVEVLDRHLDWHPSIAFRGLNSLHVRLHPRT
ncbi:MAG TPA: cytochrome P450 [Stellaceae bacterium]|nr:cytochrome P450 [Stellaceae bacterium]